MRQLSLFILGMAVLTGTAWAGKSRQDLIGYEPGQWQQRDYAIIRSVIPRYEYINQPRQECHSELVSEQQARTSYAGAILGGVTGGALGHQVGKGRGKTVATVAGTLLGTFIGNQLDNASGTGNIVQREVQRCYQVNAEVPQVRDYQVEYEYRSQIYTASMNRYPGQIGTKIPVKVTVELAD